MNKLHVTWRSRLNTLAALLGVVGCIGSMSVTLASDDLHEHGRYVFYAAGCISCHTRDQLMAGGRSVVTPFGTFYPPNATPQREYGIGGWSEEDFIRALREGVSPRGEHYYPAFPYGSYTRMSRQDMQALYAYLMTLPASSSDVPSHELYWPYSIRPLIAYWKAQRFSPGEYTADPSRSPRWNRGAYLAEALGHCGECHTPRGRIGDLLASQWLAGAPNPDGEGRVPNITPAGKTISSWSTGDIEYYLESGFTPDFDTTGGTMVAVQENMARLTAADRKAIAAYLKAVPSVE